ncbi:MAG: glycosyltransferase family 4 protein [Desulfobacterales bacterium]|uniref:Glycosyltransferase family 4 protein n=1 Tax=Candidatus Desulfatibia vada TaxID=2841696 RepID=A0A8J6P0V4_9BACT|nr:glycosyltransferase family 4 protein [Candidatus Desulfatibia vada]
MGKNIGFVSTRFAGTDGVTLEASKWADVFENSGHKCFWFAGKLDRNADRSLLVPEAHFQHDKNVWINSQVDGTIGRTPSVTQAIHFLRSQLKTCLYQFIEDFNLDILIAENVLSIPMHVPLGLALTETIAETQIPTIAHHHDFSWERIRFSVNALSDYIRMAFPPNLPNIKHIVINSEAQEQLALRTGISSIIIPNVLDFENPPKPDIEAARVFREAIGLEPNDKMILQPTRIVQRKGIEYAIELVKELKDPCNKLVVSHEAGDEGYEYAEWLQEYAREHDVNLRLITTRIADPLSNNGNGECEYSLWDVYPFADFITYPSLYEGFGNAFLEAIYFKKPILINRYATFVRDIEPLGFDLAVMDGYLSRKTVQSVVEILEKPERRKQMVNYNYKVAARHYSYSVLRTRLNAILNYFFGSDVIGLSGKATLPIYEGMDIASHQIPHRHFDSHSYPRRSV